MFKLLSTLLFSSLLLFQTTSIAEEMPQEQNNEVVESETEQISESPEENSEDEAQQEADAAEAAELREAGVGEEPMVE